MKFTVLATLALAASRPALAAVGGVDSSKDVRYNCVQDSDCVVKNKGNCCGYFPVCANQAAVFTPQDACPKPGGVSVCGFVVIQSCVCQQRKCVAVTGTTVS